MSASDTTSSPLSMIAFCFMVRPLGLPGPGVIWREKIRRLLPPVISSFLCFVFVVVKPLSSLGGQYAFLCYTSLLLFCFPGGTIGGQLEATILGILFTVAGLAWAIVTLAIAAYCGRTYSSDGAEARTVLGLGLATLAFIAGFIRSYAPRLTLASRIGLFFPVFLLTSEQAITQVTARLFLEQFYIALFAAAFGLVPIVLLGHRSSGPALGCALLGSLSSVQEVLPISLTVFLEDEGPTATPPAWHKAVSPDPTSSPSQHAEQAKELKSRTARISPLLKAYSNEMLYARSPPTHLQPIVTALKAVSRNPLLGSSNHTPGERIQAALLRVRHHSSSRPTSALGTPRRGSSNPRHSDGGRFAHELEKRLDAVPSYLRSEVPMARQAHTPTVTATPDTRLAERWTELSRCVCAAVRISGDRIAGVWAWINPFSSSQLPESAVRSDLVSAIKAFETDLELALDPEESFSRALSGSRTPARTQEWRHSLETHTERDNFRLAFHMISLLDLGRDVLKLYDVVERVTAAAPKEKRRYIPYLHRWIRSRADVQPVNVLDDSDIAGEETASGAADETSPPDPTGGLDFIQAALRREHHAQLESRGRLDALRLLWRSVWDSHKILLARIGVSRFLHLSRHSRHSRFALKLTLGISLLSLPAFLPPGSLGRMWFEDVRGGWVLASYLYVLEVHTGAIFRVGFFRIVGTFSGALFAYIFALIARDNPYALVTLATVMSIPISYIILFTTFPGVGTVAGITLPPLLFLNYLDLSMGRDPFFLAWTRFIDITIGIVAAVLVGSLIWPDHARVRYFSAVHTTLERLTDYYLQLSRDNLRSTLLYQSDQKIYSDLDRSVRREIASARTLVSVQRNEVSLLPRPIRLYGEVLDAAERIIETLTEIRLLRFSVPRKETVLDVLPIRSEFVSAVLINLWACGQAFRSRSPLPQFLPMPRVALEELTQAVDEQRREGRRRTRSSRQAGASGSSSPSAPAAGGKGSREQLAMLYAMAEHEALGELCDLIDELIAAARTLFGSQTFLDTAIRQPFTEGI